MARSVSRSPDELRLAPDGAELLASVLDMNALNLLFAALDVRDVTVGARLFGAGPLRSLLDHAGAVGAAAGRFISNSSHPVRAVLFDKTSARNWAVAWHQDRVIAVRERLDVDGFCPWTRKDGAVHVAPPYEVLAGMITLRIHLDPVPLTNAPLLVAPGSHLLGRIPETEVASIVASRGIVPCPAAAGDIWVYSTPILHASERSSAPKHRRVLQVDYGSGCLPGGLKWLGV